MHHIGYTSRAVGDSSTAALRALCEQSEAHNHAIGVTGLLVFDSVRYIKLIEGEQSTVRQLMARIATDHRHDKIVYFIDGPTSERAFDRWDLACVGFKENFSSLQLVCDVKAKLSNVKDVYILASFIGFAALAK